MISAWLCRFNLAIQGLHLGIHFRALFTYKYTHDMWTV